MKRTYLIFLICLFGFQLAIAQKETSLEDEGIQIPDSAEISNIVYLEVGGIGGFYSVNFESRLSGDLWGRSGVGYLPNSVYHFFSVPVSVSYLFGNGPSYFEFGLGASYWSYENLDFSFYPDPDKERDDTVQEIILTGTIGYRYQPQKKGFFFEAAFTPLMFAPWVGLSFGYSF